MKVTQIEISIEWDNSGEYEYECTTDSIDNAIRELKKLKKKYQNNNTEDEWE